MFIRKLSQTLGAITKGFAYDTPLTPLTVMQIISAPAAASATAVRTSVTLTTAEQVITSSINSPATPRALTVTGSASGMVGTVTVYGKDVDGYTRSEEFALNGTATITGNVPFATVLRIKVPAKTNVSGDAITVGTSNKLGLDRTPASNTSVLTVEVDGTGEAAAAQSAAYSTFTPTTVPNATRNYRVYYKTKVL